VRRVISTRGAPSRITLGKTHGHRGLDLHKRYVTACALDDAQLDDAKLGDQVTQTLANRQSRTVTRAGPVMGHIIDMADHYSQLANYMRLNNILPPTALPRPRPPGGD
jgi:hypothetical protein